MSTRDELITLLKTIRDDFTAFSANASIDESYEKFISQAKFSRARKMSVELNKAFCQFRKLSVKLAKEEKEARKLSKAKQ